MSTDREIEMEDVFERCQELADGLDRILQNRSITVLEAVVLKRACDELLVDVEAMEEENK